MGELPLGEPGHYINVTFGYWVQYPPDWYTGFGNRPLLVSFSDLDPGTHNRNSMRAEGCLIEINAATNIYGFTFEGLMSQLPLSFPDAERFELDGQPALRVRRGSGENPFDSEEVYVEHDHRLFLITFDYAREASELCRPVWEDLLANWQWFTPQFAVYRNTDYGYAVSHPRSWYRFNPEARGISFSNARPLGRDRPAGVPQRGHAGGDHGTRQSRGHAPEKVAGCPRMAVGPDQRHPPRWDCRGARPEGRADTRDPGDERLLSGALGQDLCGDLSISGRSAGRVPADRQRHHLQL